MQDLGHILNTILAAYCKPRYISNKVNLSCL